MFIEVVHYNIWINLLLVIFSLIHTGIGYKIQEMHQKVCTLFKKYTLTLWKNCCFLFFYFAYMYFTGFSPTRSKLFKLNQLKYIASSSMSSRQKRKQTLTLKHQKQQTLTHRSRR